ncbi:DUF3488 and transglutaminase-like domain-containing protein [Streptodolium elevatio]|uniref:DUF3488 and transglutaminase-like domain-containing protein n=1 Tax=Streptodolium elevatio TaxID=3157996 RepID=A0ABV3D9R4_9ACTN
MTAASAPGVGRAPTRPGTRRPADGPTRQAQLSLVPVSLLALCAGAAFRPVFGWPAIAGTVTVAALLPVALTYLVSARLRFPLASAAALTMLCALVAGCATLFGDRAPGGFVPTPALARELGTSLADAPQTLLGMVLPAPADSRLLVLVFAIVWLVAWSGAELALRGRGVLVPALPAAVALAVVPLLAVGAPQGGLPLAMPAIVIAGAMALIRTPDSAVRTEQLVTGGVLVGVLALIAGLITPAMPGGSRRAVDLRPHARQAEPLTVQGVNPLERLSSWLRDPERPMFTVSAPDAPADQLWRLTVFDEYDGIRWRPVHSLVASGGRVPPGPDAETAARSLSQHIVVDQLPGPWLPSADRPESVDVSSPAGMRIAVDPEGGVLAGDRRLPPGSTYSVVSKVAVHSPERTQYAVPADDPEGTALPYHDATGAPIETVDALRALAQEATAGTSFPYEQAVRLAEWLRARCVFDEDAVPGHGYRHLEFFLGSSRRGTSEQFAAAFAVLARTLNLPSRVVVGFRSPMPTEGRLQVRAGDALAWAEVHFADVGWISFFPTPEPGPAAVVPPPPPEPVVEPAPAPAPAPAQGQDPSEAEKQKQDQADGSGSSRDGIPLWALVVGAVVVLAVLVALGLALRPTVVRRRRMRGPPERRILGAWEQLQVRLLELGMPATGALTATEVAEYARARVGDRAGEAAGVLARICNELAFAADPAPMAQTSAASLAWRCCREVEAEVRAERRRDRAMRRRAKAHAVATTIVPRRRRRPPADAWSHRRDTGTGKPGSADPGAGLAGAGTPVVSGPRRP